jgi:hypothetical protein
MMHRRSFAAYVVALVVAFVMSFAASPARADKDRDRDDGGWKKLGERTVNGKFDKDAMEVGGDEGTFTAIRVKVEGSALEMYDIKVLFKNGDVFSPATRLVFGKDSWTRVIDLPGDRRVIKRVEFKYGNLPGGGNARVELWGKQGGGGGGNGGRDNDGDGWRGGKGDGNGKGDRDNNKGDRGDGMRKLGERTVNGKFDKDTVNVGADDGFFTAIQVKVEGSALEMYDIKVVFVSGATFSPNTRLVFGKDTWTRVIDLPGDKRLIKRVEFKYGNLPGGGNARVELWGRR